MEAATVLTFSAKYGVAMACLPTLSVLGNRVLTLPFDDADSALHHSTNRRLRDFYCRRIPFPRSYALLTDLPTNINDMI